jgi:hypothetical protein
MPTPSEAIPLGSTTCGYLVAAAAEECGARALWHGLWTRNDDGTSPLDGGKGSATPLCPVHTLELIRRGLIVDWHTFGGSCCMPGTVWHFAEDDQDTSRCVWVDEDGHQVVAFAELEQMLTADTPTRVDTPARSHLRWSL